MTLRLQEVTGFTNPFKGISVVTVGFVFQLKSVIFFILNQPFDELRVLEKKIMEISAFFLCMQIFPKDIGTLKARITEKGQLSASAQNILHLYTTRAASSEDNLH